MSKARFPKVIFLSNSQSKTVAKWSWGSWQISVNHRSICSFALKLVIVTLSSQRNRNMVALSQLPKQKLLCHAHIPAQLPWPPAASVEGLYPHAVLLPNFQTSVTVPSTLRHHIPAFWQLKWALKGFFSPHYQLLRLIKKKKKNGGGKKSKKKNPLGPLGPWQGVYVP